jgi:hypothetical protein
MNPNRRQVDPLQVLTPCFQSILVVSSLGEEGESAKILYSAYSSHIIILVRFTVDLIMQILFTDTKRFS